MSAIVTRPSAAPSGIVPAPPAKPAVGSGQVMAVAVTRAAIIAEARRFIGTPYRHQASLAGAGCDCLGLVRGVWRALYGPEPEPLPPYTPDWGEAARREVLLEVAHRHLRRIEIRAAKPGDVLVFRMREGRIAKHCAIFASSSTMIHAQSRDSVREVSLSAPWYRRMADAFSFPNVIDD